MLMAGDLPGIVIRMIDLVGLRSTSRSMRRLLRAAVVAGLCALLPAVVRADAPDAGSKPACMASYEQAQRLRLHGQLRAAKHAALSCSQASCPVALREDCTIWLTELQRSTPTVVISAQDSQGHDLTDVRVWMDDEMLRDGLTGGATDVDPGTHRFKLATRAGLTAQREALIKQAEKDRPLAFTLGAEPPPQVPPAASTHVVSAQPAEHSESWASPTSAFVIGGLGVACLLVGGIFALRTRSQWNLRNEHCPGGACDADAVAASDDAHRSAWIANVAVGVGLVGVGVGTVLLVTASSPRPDAPSPSASLRGLALGLGGAW